MKRDSYSRQIDFEAVLGFRDLGGYQAKGGRTVAHTGGVITACGIILASTFATLTTSPLQVVLQIGAAVAVGILIDTFIVQAFLVPVLATPAGQWSWWPSRLLQR